MHFAWQKSAAQAKVVLSQCVCDELHQRISGRLTAREAWVVLTNEFDNKAEDQLFRECLNFFSVEWADNEDAPTVLARIKNQHRDFSASLQNRKVETVSDLLQLLFVSKVLHILPKQLESFKSSYLLMKANENKTIDDIAAALILHERNVAPVPTSHQSGKILAMHDQKRNPNRTAKNFNQRRQRNGTPTNTENKNVEIVCKYCGGEGHYLKQCACWKADGCPPYPARAGGSNATKKLTPAVNEADASATKIALVIVSSDVLSATTNNDEWYVDNGATRHTTHNFNWFTKYEPFSGNCVVTAANGNKVKAHGRGVVEVSQFYNGKLENFTLNEVWYVPEIARNLFSVLAAHDRNPSSKFDSDQKTCRFSVNDQTIFTGTREANGTLYRASFVTVQPQMTCVNLVDTSQILQLYHQRWGHMDKQYVSLRLKSELGIDVKPGNDICAPCQFGKAHCRPFGTQVRTTTPGKLLSGDVCGPFDVSFSKRKYLIVIKDHFSHYRYYFVTREKSAVKDAIREVLSKARTLGHQVKEFLSDNGGEFDNEDVRLILKEFGVVQRLTAPYTPQQNGAVERENRTIVEMARTMKYSNPDIKFPAAIRAELVTSAGYILNRVGRSSVDGKSPYEVWFRRKPRINHFRIIGSKYFVHIPAQKRRKMDSKAVIGYLVGYDGDERYRIYVPEKHDIILSRDVTFQEKIGDCDERISLPIIKDKPVEPDNEPVEEKPFNSPTDEVIGISDKAASSELPSSDDEADVSRPQRNRKAPMYLKDYVTVAEAFVLEDDPKTYAEAMYRDNKSEWRRAMETELKSMHSNQAWNLIDLPPGKFAINNKWVIRLKRHPDGTIDKYRARMVIQGCAQCPGIDYEDTFSPVTRLDTVRSLIAVAALNKMKLMQFDVSIAFLYSDLNEEIYMRQPIGFSDSTNRVCRLKRSLYGLKQASRCWNRKFDDFMVSLKFVQSREDPCVYIRHRHSNKIIVALYVDDGLVASTSIEELNAFITGLKSKFKITSKELSYFLGLEISYVDGNILLAQTAFIDKILQRFNMGNCNPVATPMEKLPSPFSKDSGKESIEFPYRSAVGALLYLARGTRFDIAFTISVLSRLLENPTLSDVGMVKRVMRYLAGTKNLKLVYRCQPDSRVLGCYSDADFAGCHVTYRSTSGVVIMFAGAAITWFSRHQQVVADSTCEAEMVAANAASKEIIWVSRLLKEFIGLSDMPVLCIDNEAARRLSENPEFHFRTKHIQRKYFFIRDRIKQKMLEVRHIGSEANLTDIFTKPMFRTRLIFLREKLGLMPT